MRRTTLAVFTLLVATVLFPVAATAEGPIRVPLPSDPIQFGAGEVCAFPVLLESINNRQTIKIFPDGRQIVTGGLTIRVSRLDANGDPVESTDVVGSGPIFITPNADGTLNVKGTGSTLFFFFAGDLDPEFHFALLHMTGLVEETVNADFTEVLAFEHRGGTTENLCDTLAP